MPRKGSLSVKDKRDRAAGNFKRKVASEFKDVPAKDTRPKSLKGEGKKSPFRQSLSKGKGKSKRMPIGQARERIGESFGVSGSEIQKFLKGFSNTKDPGNTDGPVTRKFPRRR